MVDKSSNRNKGSISEDEISTLLQRYPATTVLTLLQEVAFYADIKIDWDEIAKNTSTGISNAREYRRLWRHLAYRHALPNKLEDAAVEPLGDDSDVEYELEAFPSVSSEASAEAAACVKVLIASASNSDSSGPSGSSIEAPLIINIPNSQHARNCTENQKPVEGTNITVPVFVQKHNSPSMTSAETPEAIATAWENVPARKRRKPWSEEEDMELIAAVRKCGEGNWANIVKGYFKGNRAPSQLSQRWAIIKKKYKVLKADNSNGPILSEVQLAASQAVRRALDMPKWGTISRFSAGLPPASTEALAIGGNTSNFPNHSEQVPPGALVSMPNSRATTMKALPKSPYSPDSMVKAAAVAAGARIATQDDAASVIKSATAVHIMGPGGSSLVKPPLLPGTSNVASCAANTNMSYICSSLPVAPVSSHQQPNGGHSSKAAATAAAAPSSIATSPKKSIDQANATATDPVILTSSQEVAKVGVPEKPIQGNHPSVLESVLNGKLKEDEAVDLRNSEAAVNGTEMAMGEELKHSSEIDGKSGGVTDGCQTGGSDDAEAAAKEASERQHAEKVEALIKEGAAVNDTHACRE